MSLAKEINLKLDEIIALKEELVAMEQEVPQDSILLNKETGDEMTLDDAIGIAEGVIDKVKEDLSAITNEGQNVKDVFTNMYYINDMMEDKRVAEEQIQKKLNKAKPNKLDSN
tara:strand:- start:394 stop:732 length:339 start_codon:yes stop_codon:yes gene_type:complete